MVSDLPLLIDSAPYGHPRVRSRGRISALQSITYILLESSDPKIPPRVYRASRIDVVNFNDAAVVEVNCFIHIEKSCILMPILPRVYAYRDHGSMGPTRWEPRKTICTSDPGHAEQPGQVYVAKFCQGGSGAAAMISEVVCRRLFEAAGILVLDAVIVDASESFARSWNEMGRRFRIEPGEYFGTLFLEDVLPGPALEADDLDDLRDIVLIWAMDALVGNLDRNVWGNMLLKPIVRSGKLQLIAADQSDCFCGSGVFADGSWRTRMEQQRAIGPKLLIEAIGATGGQAGILRAIELTAQALNAIGSACEQVPPAWWEKASINPDEIEGVLRNRLRALPNLLDIERWGTFDYGQYEGIPLL
jgi:hypothetical protein